MTNIEAEGKTLQNPLKDGIKGKSTVSASWANSMNQPMHT